LQVSDKSEIVIELIEDEKRNYLVVADNVAFQRVKQVTIRKSEITAKIGFKPGLTHQEKIKKMLKYYQKLNGKKH
jgi:NAD kinase